MKSQYYNKRGRVVGWVEDNCYNSIRDFDKGHIFRKPTYGSAVGIDIRILKDLISKDVHKLKFLIKNFEKNSFWVEIKIEEFLKKSWEVNFDKVGADRKTNISQYGKQRVCPMNNWTRVYADQEKIERYL